MRELTKRESQIMRIVWQLESAFIRDIIEAMPEPKPHYNSVATIVKILADKKGFLQAEKVGNTLRYRPTANFKDFRDDDLDDIKEKYFDGSLPKLLAHFAKSSPLSDAEREELIKIIKSKK